MKSLIDYYDDNAELWANNWYDNNELLPYLKRFLTYLPKSPRVLDLCCGAGYESMRLHNLGADVVGVDLSEGELKIARERNPEIKFYKKDMIKSYKDLGNFDGIACIAGIVHLETEQLSLCFEKMSEVLKSGGYLFLVYGFGKENVHSLTYNGEVYARNFISHTREEILSAMNGKFEFVEELEPIRYFKHEIYRLV